MRTIPSKRGRATAPVAAVALAAVTLAGCGRDAPEESTAPAVVTTATTERGTSFLAPPEKPGEPDEPGTAETEAEGDTEPKPQYTSMASYLNPGLSTNLLADPGQTAGETIPGLITFASLSLTGVDVDELYDYIFKPETERAKRFVFPENIQAKAGRDKAVVGYMKIVNTNSDGGVTSFYLMRDLASCCFGGSPRPDEWMMVHMKGDTSTQLHQYVPVTVRGDFEVGIDRDKDEYAVAIYKIQADSIELYEAPAASK